MIIPSTHLVTDGKTTLTFHDDTEVIFAYLIGQISLHWDFVEDFEGVVNNYSPWSLNELCKIFALERDNINNQFMQRLCPIKNIIEDAV